MRGLARGRRQKGLDRQGPVQMKMPPSDRVVDQVETKSSLRENQVETKSFLGEKQVKTKSSPVESQVEVKSSFGEIQSETIKTKYNLWLPDMSKYSFQEYLQIPMYK